MLRIEHRRMNDAIVLDVKGKIAPGDPEHAFAAAVRSAVRQGYRKLVLNLAEATSSDASGISALLDAYLQMRASGGELKLLRIERRFAQLLTVVALYPYFDVRESEEEALASFRSASRLTGTVMPGFLAGSMASSIGA